MTIVTNLTTVKDVLNLNYEGTIFFSVDCLESWFCFLLKVLCSKKYDCINIPKYCYYVNITKKGVSLIR